MTEPHDDFDDIRAGWRALLNDVEIAVMLAAVALAFWILAVLI